MGGNVGAGSGLPLRCVVVVVAAGAGGALVIIALGSSRQRGRVSGEVDAYEDV